MAKTLIGNIKGPKGDKGADGAQGAQGPTGATGATGPQGLDGDSAYQIAVNNGFEGSEEDWLASLEGGTFVGTITGTNPTIQDSTNAPFIYGKFKGYTLQDGEPTPDNPVEINGLAKDGAIEVKTTGKNIFGGLALARALVDSGSTNVVLDENAKTIQYGRKIDGSYTLFDKFKENTQYTIMLNGNHSNNSNATYSTNLVVTYTDGTTRGIDLNNTGEFIHLFATQVNKSVSTIHYGNGDIDTTTLNYEQCGIFEGVITAEEFEPYTETTANIPTDAPLYEGDYLEVYADGSGKLVRKMKEVVFDGDEQFSISGMLSNDNRLAVYYNPIDAKMSIDGVNSISNQLKRISCTEAHNDETKTGFFVGDTTYNPNLSFIVLVFPSTTATDLSTLQAWLQSNPVTVVYELAEPTETLLTAEQVAEFKKLYSFEHVTNVFCEGETEIQYYKNTPSGVAVGTVHRMANDEKSTYDVDDVLSETSTNPVQNKVITEALIKHNHKQKKIIVVTDSYGVPVREDDGTYGSWVDMLAEKYEVLKIASGGAGFVSYFNNKFLNNLKATTIENKDTYTDIIVSGGVNDAGDSTKPITAEDISNGIIEFCDYCKENFPNAKIHIACVGGITPRSNLKERCLNLHNTVFQAYANTNADYDYCTFSESIFYDRSLLINVHPTEEGHIETYKYFNRMLNGQCSFTRNFNSVVTLTSGTQVGLHGTISNGVPHYTGQRIQFTLGVLEIGPAYNFATGVEVGTIDNNGVLAVPSRAGYVPYVIIGSLYVARTQPSSLAYAGVGFLYPNEDGTKLLLQITSPDLVGSANDKIKANFYFIPTPTVIAQTTA